jgi:photosynthetic reaction center H subunit
MHIGSFGGNFDVAEVVLATFVLFFLGLVRYLQRENNREGFPLREIDGSISSSEGFSGIPAPKYFLLPSGETVASPRYEAPEPIAGVQIAGFPGAPFEPVGNKLTAGLGPSAFARRADLPEKNFFDGGPRIKPLRLNPEYSLATEEPEIRGFAVEGADRIVAGTLHEVWIDRYEMQVRYFEVALSPACSGRNVLVPSAMADIQWRRRTLVVGSVLASQFTEAPGTKSLDEVTALEEDQITAYFAGGTLYATPARSEPLL